MARLLSGWRQDTALFTQLTWAYGDQNFSTTDFSEWAPTAATGHFGGHNR